MQLIEVIEQAQAKFNDAEFKKRMEELQAKFNSPEFRKQMEKFNSPEFKKQMEDLQTKFDSPELRKQMETLNNEVQEQMEQVRKQIDDTIKAGTAPPATVINPLH